MIPCKKQVSNWGKYTYVLLEEGSTRQQPHWYLWRTAVSGRVKKREREREGERKRHIDTLTEREREGKRSQTDADCRQLPLSLCKTWLIECRMPPDKGHCTLPRRTLPRSPLPYRALPCQHYMPSTLPQTIQAAALTSALWPSKNIIIIKMKMKQKRKKGKEREIK